MLQIQSTQLTKLFRGLSIVLLFAALFPYFTGGVKVARAAGDEPGAVYALSNAVTGNAVNVYARGADGSLTPAGSFATGGNGSGAGLGSQGGVIVSDDHQRLFAVNAGSNSISSFRIQSGQVLQLVNTVASGGVRPTSIAYHQGLLYVLNAGVPNNLSGFTVAQDGTLSPLADSTRPLSGASTTPSQVSFDDTGRVIVVTERGANMVDTYVVGNDGRLSAPTSYPSAGPAPYGFAIDKRNTLLVSEAGANGGASAYRLGADGSLVRTSSMLMSGQRAACWTVITKNGRFGYVANAGTSNISGFAIAQDGTVAFLNTDGVTAVTPGGPSDMAVSHNSQFLYARIGSANTIAIFSINADGSLTVLPALTGLPAGMAGLAAY
ncbi:MAG: beta-propeller fold lactonase family protein [Caldilineaceae bacterium]